jgi:hypothetical protein
MPQLKTVSPQISVRLYKTISRKTIDGKTSVSERYAGKSEFIDLTPFLGDGSSVRTSKSVREPAGSFTISFMDKAQGATQLESVYGLVEPMDVVEIRMWGGLGAWRKSKDGKPLYPIVMRGFVSDIHRQASMSPDGRPMRSVVVTGMDYGKIWQTYQALYLPAYAEGKALLTSFQLSELFGFKVVAAMKAGDFVRTMFEKIINPHIAGFLPDSLPEDIPKKIQTGSSIAVKHGMVGQHFQSQQGPIYEIIKNHADVGHWNELYTEDREDGVHCVYRPIPALHLTAESIEKRKIQDDAPDPVYVGVPDWRVERVAVMRSDANLANFYWVNGQRYDLIDDMTRRLSALQDGNKTVSTKEYPNTAVQYYGVRPMYADTQMSGDEITNDQSGKPAAELKASGDRQEAWIEKRRRQLVEMNRDNVVLERGSATVKGGLMRDDGVELMKAGDYARFQMGQSQWDAYVVQVDHEFVPYQGYTQTLSFERGEGFAERAQSNRSPWLTEQATKMGVV